MTPSRAVPSNEDLEVRVEEVFNQRNYHDFEEGPNGGTKIIKLASWGPGDERRVIKF